MSNSTEDLFGAASAADRGEQPASAGVVPLAVRMRPRSLDEVRGQVKVLRPGSPLRRLIEGSGGAAGPLSAILWGPPGTGKTTLAHLVATAAERRFVELSAVTAGVKDVRSVMESAVRERDLYGRQTVLFLDEIHRFTKAQQDALLPGVENRTVILVAATTENPSFSIIAPLLSRSVLVTLESLSDEEIAELLAAALADERGFGGAHTMAVDATDHLVRIAGGDARRALTSLEAAAGVALDAQPPGRMSDEPVEITLAHVEQAVAQAAVRYDRAGDQHYDVASALIKSMRGSDVDAALHYLARMLEAGEDPRFVARRLIISASEDVGMADPTAPPLAGGPAPARQLIGMPGGGDVPRPAGGGPPPGPQTEPPRAGPQVERLLPGDRGGRGRRPRRPRRPRAGAPARRSLPGRGPARARQGLPVRPRRPARRRRAAVRARRGGRPHLLHPDRPWLR